MLGSDASYLQGLEWSSENMHTFPAFNYTLVYFSSNVALQIQLQNVDFSVKRHRKVIFHVARDASGQEICMPLDELSL